MSKKIAAGADGIVLDVKCGSGAFMKTQKDAEALAHIMVEMGQHVGRKVTAIISGMDQPLGMYIGNSLEVMEAMEVLKGNVKGDLLEVSLLLGAHMLLLAGRVPVSYTHLKDSCFPQALLPLHIPPSPCRLPTGFHSHQQTNHFPDTHCLPCLLYTSRCV